MIKIYDFSPDDFQQPENSEFMIIIKTEARELEGYNMGLIKIVFQKRTIN